MRDQRPVLNQLNLVVRDMEASAAFYRRLGVEIEDSGPDHRTATNAGPLDFDLDSGTFAKVWNSAARDAPCVVIGFGVASRDDVDRRYQELTAAGYRGQQRPYDAFWGARYAIVEDPDGNPVGLMSPADPQRRSWPRKSAPK
jgi:catechol 2,3-dioxygenase-like lactoylglutathione lyase family enzyme